MALVLLSLSFYIWSEPNSWWLMGCYTIVIYLCAIGIGEFERYKKIILTVGILACLSGLFIFKYFDFFIKMSGHEAYGFLLPAGISFYTFHSISYLVDIFRQEKKPTKSIVNLALYISFFPQLIAGPIIRYKDIAEQIEKRVATWGQFEEGFYRFIRGLAKKVILADNLALVADKVFNFNLENQFSPSVLWLGAFAYTLQIYYDFSGYSDMAIGLAKFFGIDFKENFRNPYRSKSVQEFWRRWHISLSTWFRDYVYIPLGGNRKGTIHTYLNLMIIFALCGFWHGANWTFLAWGLYQGFFLICERILGDERLDKIPISLRYLYMMLVVPLGWVLFRSDSITNALVFYRGMFSSTPALVSYSIFDFLNPETALIFIVSAIFALFPLNVKLEGAIPQVKIVKPIFFLCLYILSLVYVASSTHSPFIYFRF